MDPEPPNDAAPPASPAPPGPTTGVSTPASPPPPTDHRTPPLPQLITELRDLVVNYVKQQTLVPLQQLGRYIGFGLAGSLLLGLRGRVPRPVGPARPARRDRRHVHRRLVVGPVPHRDRRADARWRTRLARTRRAPLEEGGAERMTPANEPKPVTRADIEAKLQQIKHVTDSDHRHGRRRGQGRNDRRRRPRGRARVLVRSPARAQEEHHRRDPPHLMACS